MIRYTLVTGNLSANMNKVKRYTELVQKRKNFIFQSELVNPSESKFDNNEIEPWASWQNDLNADIVVIGQEFCDYETYIKTEGKVEQFENKFEYPSNKNLREFLKIIGRDPGHPCKPNKQARLFFTNSVMALKNGTMSSNFRDKWLKQSREEFLIPLLDIINPNIIICIGGKATKSVSKIYGFKTESLTKMVNKNPIKIHGKKVFAMFHSGGLGIRNRSLNLQTEDWKKIINWL